MSNHRHNPYRDVALIVVSVLVAVYAVRSGLLDELFRSSGEIRFLGVFLAGFFWVSLFTAAPATAVIIELANRVPILEIVVVGGLGALVGDLFILSVIKNHVTETLNDGFKRVSGRSLKRLSRRPFLHWFLPALGALIIASPFPDEIGLGLMGLAKTNKKYIAPLSFFLNALGILGIALAARALR